MTSVRRLSHEESERMKEFARDILCQYRKSKAEERGRSVGSILPVVVEVMRLGESARASVTAPFGLTPAQQWVVNVTWKLAAVGPVSAFILEERLARRDKSDANRNFDVIAMKVRRSLWKNSDSEEARDRFDENAARRLFNAALPKFVNLLRDAGITCDFNSGGLRVKQERQIGETREIAREVPRSVTDVLNGMTMKQTLKALRRVTAVDTHARREVEEREAETRRLRRRPAA